MKITRTWIASLLTSLLVAAVCAYSLQKTVRAARQPINPPFAPGYASNPAPNSTIDLGITAIGSYSAPKTITISETGNAALRITSHSLSGPNAGDFKVTPATLTIPDGGVPQSLNITCTPNSVGSTLTTILSVAHNASGSPASYFLTCAGSLPDPFADAIGPGITGLVSRRENALGAPDGNVAGVVGRVPDVVHDGFRAVNTILDLDLGAGEEGTGDLKVHVGRVVSDEGGDLSITVEFLNAAGTVLGSGVLQLAPINTGGISVVTVSYTGSPTPYRFVRLHSSPFGICEIDAVEAVSFVH